MKPEQIAELRKLLEKATAPGAHRHAWMFAAEQLMKAAPSLLALAELGLRIKSFVEEYDVDKFTLVLGDKKPSPRKVPTLTPEQRLAEIWRIIGDVDTRCAGDDGPIGRFQDEVTDKELRRIYQLANGALGHSGDGALLESSRSIGSAG